MQALKLTEVLRMYEGKWVVLNGKRTQVLASDASIEKVMNVIKEKCSEKPVITFVPRFDTDYVG